MFYIYINDARFCTESVKKKIRPHRYDYYGGQKIFRKMFLRKGSAGERGFYVCENYRDLPRALLLRTREKPELDRSPCHAIDVHRINDELTSSAKKKKKTVL